MVLSAALVETSEEPKEAPPMELRTVKATEPIAANPETSAHKRAFGASILLMPYAILRFAGVRRIRMFEVNEDSVRGALMGSKP